MKIIHFLFVLGTLTMVAAEEKYTDRYDNTNLDEVITNKRLLTAYLNCLLDIGRCTAEGRELKSHMKEALETHCAKCTDAQKRGTRRIMGHLINNEPQYWNALTAKYDPGHKFTKLYEDELRTIKG